MAPRKANRKGNRKRQMTAEEFAQLAEARAKARQASTGNEWWKARGRHGRLPIVPETDEARKQLLENIEDYFQWCEDNPLKEDKVMSYEGVAFHEEVDKKRIPLLVGLCGFLGIGEQTWRGWKVNRRDLSAIIEWAEERIRQEGITGATGGLYNPMIVARLHRLAEVTEVSGPNGGPVATISGEMTPEQAAEEYRKTREGRE